MPGPAQFGRQEFQGARLVHERVLGEIDGAHAALAQLADDAVTVVDDHPRLEVANLVERHTVGGAGDLAVGVAGGALRALFHAFALRFQEIPRRIHCGTVWRGAQRQDESIVSQVAKADGKGRSAGGIWVERTKGPWLKPFLLRACIQRPEGPCSLRRAARFLLRRRR